MSRPRPRRRASPVAALALAALLFGCVQPPKGPILGDWRGVIPGRAFNQPEVLELVLEGTPADTTGRYHYAATLQDILNGVGSGTNRWEGDWTRQAGADGNPVYVLHHVLPDQITRWRLLPDGTLVPADLPGLSFSPSQLRPYILHPLPRDSRNYGLD